MYDIFWPVFLSEYLGLILTKPNYDCNKIILSKTYLKFIFSILFVTYYLYNLTISMLSIKFLGKFGNDMIDFIVMLFNIKFSILTIACIFINHYLMQNKLKLNFKKLANKIFVNSNVTFYKKAKRKIRILVILTLVYYMYTLVSIFIEFNKTNLSTSLCFIIAMCFPHFLMNFPVLQFIAFMYIFREHLLVTNNYLTINMHIFESGNKNCNVPKKSIESSISKLINIRDMIEDVNIIYQIINVLGVLKMFLTSVYNAYYMIKIFWSWFGMSEPPSITMDIINWFFYTHFMELYTIRSAERCLDEVSRFF